MVLSPALEHTCGSWISCFPCVHLCSSLGVHVLQLFCRHDRVRSENTKQYDARGTRQAVPLRPQGIQLSSELTSQTLLCAENSAGPAVGPEQNSQPPSMLQSLKEVEPRGETAEDCHTPQNFQPRKKPALPFGEKSPSRSNKGQGGPVALVHQSSPRSPLGAFSHKSRWLPSPLKVVGLTTDRDAVATPNFSTPGQNTGRHKSPLSIALLSRRFAKSEHVKYVWEPP